MIDVQEQAKDFRSRKAYEILYEKKNITDLDLKFLSFMMSENPKVLRMIRHKNFRRIKLNEMVSQEEIEKWKKKKKN